MKNKLIGYKIRGKYYMVEDVEITDSRKKGDKEIVTVIIDEEPPNVMMYLEADDIIKIYKNDDLSAEIYKLKVDQLEYELDKANNTLLQHQKSEDYYFTTFILDETLESHSDEISSLIANQRDIQFRERVSKTTLEYVRSKVTDIELKIDRFSNSDDELNKGQIMFNVAITIFVLLMYIFQ